MAAASDFSTPVDEKNHNLLMMLDENTEILTELDDQISLANAAQQCRLVPDKLSSAEVACFPDISTKGEASQKLFLYLRNKILQLWLLDCRNELTLEKCMKKINPPYNSDADLIRRLFSFLERYGLINFGVFQIQKFKPKVNFRIGIIGAGISGLIAARQLQFFGFDVLLFEARKEVGGRIRTYKNGRYVADLGAMIITGLGGNPAGILARQFPDVEFMKIRSRCPLYEKNGSVVPKQTDEQLEREFNRLLEATAFLAHSLKMKKPSGSEFSLGEALGIVIKLQEKAVLERQLQIWKNVFNVQEKFKAEQRRSFEIRQKINEIMKEYKFAQRAKELRMEKLQQDIDDTGAISAAGAMSDTAALSAAGASDGSVFPRNDADLVLEFTFKSKKRDLVALCRDFQTIRDVAQEIEQHLIELEEMATSLEQQYLSMNDRRLLFWHIANLEFANAAPLDKLSLQFWDQDDEFELQGSHLSVTNGFVHFADELATPDLNILMDTQVTKINYASPNSCCVEVKNRPDDPFFFHAVLCTLPLGILKESVSPESERPPDSAAPIFEPPLPDWKVASIERLGFGNLNKVILCFDRIFWDPSSDVFGSIQEGCDANSCGELFQFWSISKQPVLIGLVAGKAADLIEQLNDQIIVGRALGVLRRIFGATQVPDPKFHAVTRWRKDPFARGSYSFVAVDATGDDYDLLAAPVKKDEDQTENYKIFFAGEHTIRNYPATVHGAILSGLREAGKIADHFLGTGAYAGPRPSS